MIRNKFAKLIIVTSILPLFSCGPTSSQIEINGVSFSFEESDLNINDYLMLRHRHFSDLSELGDLFLRGTFPEIVSIYRNQKSNVTMEKVASLESKQGKIHLNDPNLNETGRFYYCVSYSSNSKNYYAGFCYGGKEADEDTLKPLLELDVSQITIKKNYSTSSGYDSETFTSRAKSLKDDLIYCFKDSILVEPTPEYYRYAPGSTSYNVTINDSLSFSFYEPCLLSFEGKGYILLGGHMMSLLNKI